jgi:hypothetical protein
MPAPFTRDNPRPMSPVCVVCVTHRRPEYVPWHQHAIGCTQRAAAVAANSRESSLMLIDKHSSRP